MSTVLTDPIAGKSKVEFEISKKQGAALDSLFSHDIDELLYGGAKGGGKSVFGCIWVYTMAKLIIKEFGLKPTDKPLVIGFMGRKQGIDFNNTTLRTWQKEIPAESYELKKQEHLLVIEGTVAIQFGGLDDSDTIKKFNSAEFIFFFVDQAEEVSESDIALLRGTLRLKINGRQPKYKALLTANPAICWLKKAFITAPQPRTKFIQALPSDNPYLATTYVDTLKKAFAFNPALLNAYLYGSWDDLDVAFTVIPSSAVESCVDSGYVNKEGEKRITVCDISEDGSDETVIYDFTNYKIRRDTVEIYTHRDLMDSVGRIMAHARKNASNLIAIDKIGLGAGVFSRLQEVYGNDDEDVKVIVYGFDSRISAPGPLNDMTFANYKSYAWFKARELFKEGRVDIPNDHTLKSQLASMTWHFTNGEVIQLDKKEDVKKRLGQSPDRADACIMGLDALSRAPVIRPYDRYSRPQFARPRTSKRMNWATV